MTQKIVYFRSNTATPPMPARRAVPPPPLNHQADGALAFADTAALAQAAQTGLQARQKARRSSPNSDLVSVCVKKEIGAPMGPALCSPCELLAKAYRRCKTAGGGARQARFLAAAACRALGQRIERLAGSPALAWRLSAALADADGLEGQTLQTNKLFVSLIGVATLQLAALLAQPANERILATGRGASHRGL